MLSHYHTSINPEEENDAHSSLLRMVGFNKRVLEAGCASGHVSEALSKQGCSVVGVEIDAEGVLPAKQWVERVVIGNFDDGELWKELEDEMFDAVLFGDVLEHLKTPLETLLESLKHLLPTGAIVISVPNIAHADVKIALLNGTFPYADSGLLDRTHIHFFTKESLLELIRAAGLVPATIRLAAATSSVSRSPGSGSSSRWLVSGSAPAAVTAWADVPPSSPCPLRLAEGVRSSTAISVAVASRVAGCAGPDTGAVAGAEEMRLAMAA